MADEKLIPKLRFEFPSSWENKKLKDIIQISKDKYNPELDKTNYKCIELEHLSQGNGILLGFTDSTNQNSIKNKFNEGNILFGKLRPYLEKYYFPNFEGVCSSEIWVFDTKEYPKYIYYLIQTKRFLDIANVSSGSKMPRSDWNFMKDFSFPIPNIKTQKETSNLFSVIDKKIELLEKKHHEYNDFKKYLMQQIFAQKLRFDFNEEWQKHTFKDLLNEVSEKSTTNNQYEILSSTKEGIFMQKEYFADRNVASKDNTGYKILRKNQIVLSPQNLWMGNINVNTEFEIGIVSPSYKIYETTNLVKINYFKHILKLPRLLYEYKCASEQGASIVRRNLNKQLFDEITIQIPSLEEQQKIGNMLNLIDEKIIDTKKQIDESKQFKKGLLQQMFV